MSIRSGRSPGLSLVALLLAGGASIGAAGVCCAAGTSVLLVDRMAHKIWRLSDDNNDGSIDPTEVHVWFDQTNLAGTANPQTPFAFAIRPSDNAVVVGDVAAASRGIYLLKDVDRNGDALGANESRLVLSTANASGAIISAPSGVAFFPGFDIAVVNAGAGSNPDAIYRLHDGNDNGSYDDAGEALGWVTLWPPSYVAGNSTVIGPNEIVIDSAGVGFMRNSVTGNFGVFKFRDLGGTYGANDPGEFTPWFDSTNASGITPATGLALEVDLARPHSLYTNQTVGSGATASKQIIRLTDLDGNGDANGPGEAVVVYSVVDSGISIQDVISLPNGDVYFTDLTGKRIFQLHDLDGDGLFTSPGERTEFLSAANAAAAGIQDVRYMVWLRDLPTCAADFNAVNGLTVQDIFDFLTAWFNGDPRADFNNVNGINIQDIFDFLAAWFAGC